MHYFDYQYLEINPKKASFIYLWAGGILRFVEIGILIFLLLRNEMGLWYLISSILTFFTIIGILFRLLLEKRKPYLAMVFTFFGVGLTGFGELSLLGLYFQTQKKKVKTQVDAIQKKYEQIYEAYTLGLSDEQLYQKGKERIIGMLKERQEFIQEEKKKSPAGEDWNSLAYEEEKIIQLLNQMK